MSSPGHEGGRQPGGLPPPAPAAAKLSTRHYPSLQAGFYDAVPQPAVDPHSGLALLLVGKTLFAPQSPCVTLGSILSPLGAAGKEELTPGMQEHC